MIPYERVSWLSMVLRVHGSVLPNVWPRFLATTAVSVVFTYLQRYDAFHFSLTMTPFILTGLPLGIILGFRNSSSYERFWEGRKLWGALVNASRSFVRELETFVIAGSPDEAAAVVALRRSASLRIIAFVYALRAHLRREKGARDLEGLLDADEIQALENEECPPAAILHRLGADLRTAGERKWLHPQHAQILEATVVTLTDVLGGSERIRNTPTPISYIIFIHRSVAFYCFVLPFGVADTVHALTPVVVFFVSYALFSLDAIGDELDEPFRDSKNTLPIAGIARSIEIYIRRRLGDPNIPPPLPPRGGVLT